LCAAALIMACEPDSEWVLDPAEGEVQARAASRDAGVPVVTLPDLQLVEGASSQLVRSRNGVNYRVSTTGLEPGHAYTLWIVTFNDTEGCEHGEPGGPVCGLDDIVNHDARPDMMYAAGNVVGASGRTTFAGRRHVGDLSGSANGPVDLPAFGLEDPFGAEIWLVVHHHGPKLPAFLPDMVQGIDGGCTDAGVPEAGAESPWNDYEGPPGVGAFGRRGTNTCASVQLALHSP
jgi:hypothetical protein